MTMLTQSFPLEKRGRISAIINFVQTAAMVTSPPLGGLLVTKFTWRACFGINIPLQVLAFGLTMYGMVGSVGEHQHLSLMDKIKKLDILGTLMVVPAITCLLLGLQWGGVLYSWSNVRIVALLVHGASCRTSAFVSCTEQHNPEAACPTPIFTTAAHIFAAFGHLRTS